MQREAWRRKNIFSNFTQPLSYRRRLADRQISPIEKELKMLSFWVRMQRRQTEHKPEPTTSCFEILVVCCSDLPTNSAIAFPAASMKGAYEDKTGILLATWHGKNE